MNCHTKNNDKGSISIEAAILMALVTMIILFFISVMQIVAARNILEVSLIRTGDMMCKWAPIYKYLIADNVDAAITEGLSEELSEKLPKEVEEILLNVINLSNIKQDSMDYIYGYIAQSITQKSIDEAPLVHENFIKINNLNLYRSSFFEDDSNVIRLVATSEVETFLPFKSKVYFKINCGAWGKGVLPHTSIENDKESNTDSVWKRDNYSRGIIIRELYGGNLPETFPVISAYENGTIKMIKSINHTTPSYSDGKMLVKTVKQMLDSLATFNGKSWGGIEIKKSDIKMKIFVLVMPENTFSKAQEIAMQEIRSFATSKGIVFDLQRYQKV